MNKLSIYHINLLNHFLPSGINKKIWADYVRRLSYRDAMQLCKKCMHQSLMVVYKPKTLGEKAFADAIADIKRKRKKKPRPRFKTSPQVERKDKTMRRKPLTNFCIKE